MDFYINRDKCIACGKCYLNFPQVFDCDDEGIAYVKAEANQKQILTSQDAIYQCPTRAISQDSPSND
ncbi:ferredoxin [Vaginisenegalia massiliensis]|uniref:ferredoxin n=1 Tax=Vaginisenegalia massiliensis TaxID=2058294 RepID=UPI000F529E18|nr:ferredoxin [Vaginisenegalia massiliensis]